jgi:hypothetical protein
MFVNSKNETINKLQGVEINGLKEDKSERIENKLESGIEK